MQILKISLLALSTLALSSAAFAGGHGYKHDRGHRHGHSHGRHEVRKLIVVEKQRHASCHRDERVVYVPKGEPRIVIRPSVQIQVAWGY